MYTDNEKENAIECLQYELNMMQAMEAYLVRDMVDPISRNAFIESFLIHARALIDFIYKDESQHDDDILAIKFFAEPSEWITARGDKPVFVQEIQEDMHKWLAHISMKRKESSTKKDWDFGKIKNELLNVIYIFETKMGTKIIN